MSEFSFFGELKPFQSAAHNDSYNHTMNLGSETREVNGDNL